VFKVKQHLDPDLLVVRFLLLGLSLLEPLQERSGSLADLLGHRNVSVALGSLGAPFGDNLLADEVKVIVELQDLGDLSVDPRVLLSKVAQETLGSTEKSLLVAIARDALLEHGLALGDLSRDVLVEQSLSQNLNSTVLGLDAELLGLEVDVDRIDLVDGSLLFGLSSDPVAQIVVDGAATLLIVLVCQGELLPQLAGKLGLASFDGLFADINSPIIVLNLGISVNRGSLSLHLLQFVVADGIVVVFAIGALLGAVVLTTTVAVAVLAGRAILLSLASSLTLGLVLLALLGLVLQNETTELQAQIDLGELTTSLAIQMDATILDIDNGLGVLALLAENELVDEAIQVFLQLLRIVGAVDDPTVVLGVNVGLSTQLETKVLDDMSTRAGERLSHARQVDNDGLDTVTLALDLGLDPFHLVTIEGIADIAADIDERHVGGLRRDRLKMVERCARSARLTCRI